MSDLVDDLYNLQEENKRLKVTIATLQVEADANKLLRKENERILLRIEKLTSTNDRKTKLLYDALYDDHLNLVIRNKIELFLALTHE